MVEVITLCVTILVAIVGFIVNDRASRKAKRRDIRTHYLMTAYKAIEAGSNRAMTESVARAVEAAVADVQLLGTAAQAEVAHRFADEFASTGGADTGPLLNVLRDELRNDLDLGQLPERRTHLRIEVGRGLADVTWHEFARISAETISAQQFAVSQDRPSNQRTDAELTAWAAVKSSLDAELRAHGVSTAELSLEERIATASENGLISDGVAKSIAGLQVMHDLISVEGDSSPLTGARAQEFSVLATAIAGLFSAGLAGPVIPV